MSETVGDAGPGQPRLAATLRNGETCLVYADRMVVGTQEYPFAELTWASLVIDPGVPVAPGAPPPPALLLRLRDGREVLFSPAEPPDAWRLLGATHLARPDLRATATPRWSSSPPPPPGYGYPYGYYPRPAGSGTNDTVLAGLAHLGVFLGGWLLPLIIWLTTRTSAPYASRQAKQAFFWQLGFFIIFILAYTTFVAIFIVGFLGSVATLSTTPGTIPGPNPFLAAPFGSLVLFYAVFFGAYLVDIIFSIIGAVNAFQGRPFHYPLLGSL